MKHYPRIGLCLSALLALTACQKKTEEAPAVDMAEMQSAPAEVMADNMAPQSMMKSAGGGADRRAIAGIGHGSAGARENLSSSAAVVRPGDDRSFVRTADLDFETRAVAQTVLAIEDLTMRHGGYVGYSHLQNERSGVSSSDWGKDSVIERYFVYTNGRMTLRVPDIRLDTLLRSLSPWVVFLHHRTVTAEDVSGQLERLADQERRSRESVQRLDSGLAHRAGRVDQFLGAEEQREARRAGGDAARDQARSIQAQVKFSTVEIALRQRPVVYVDTVPMGPGFQEEPSNVSRFLDSLGVGIQVLIEISILLARAWPFVVLAGFLAYKWWRRRQL